MIGSSANIWELVSLANDIKDTQNIGGRGGGVTYIFWKKMFLFKCMFYKRGTYLPSPHSSDPIIFKVTIKLAKEPWNFHNVWNFPISSIWQFHTQYYYRKCKRYHERNLKWENVSKENCLDFLFWKNNIWNIIFHVVIKIILSVCSYNVNFPFCQREKERFYILKTKIAIYNFFKQTYSMDACFVLIVFRFLF